MPPSGLLCQVYNCLSSAISSPDLLDLVNKAIQVELDNMDYLRKFPDDFPIGDIGVAQGNSLSPLMGNIVLSEFDKRMNEGDCRCIRYIDDFIILAPTKDAANARLRRAKTILQGLGMTLSPEKSSKQAYPVTEGFDFLGIEIKSGLIRPSKKARAKFVSSIHSQLDSSTKAMTGLRHGNALDPKQSLISTLKRIDGMIDGWGKHYWFCNDRQTFAAIDEKLRSAIASYLGSYSDTRSRLPNERAHLPLGIAELCRMPTKSFAYPAANTSSEML